MAMLATINLFLLCVLMLVFERHNNRLTARLTAASSACKRAEDEVDLLASTVTRLQADLNEARALVISSVTQMNSATEALKLLQHMNGRLMQSNDYMTQQLWMAKYSEHSIREQLRVGTLQ